MNRLLGCYKKVRNTRNLFLIMCGILLFMKFAGYRDEFKITFDLLLVLSGFVFTILVAMFFNIENFLSYLFDLEMSLDDLKELDRLLTDTYVLSYKDGKINPKLLRKKIIENPSVKLKYSILIKYLTDLINVDEKKEKYKILKKMKEV